MRKTGLVGRLARRLAFVLGAAALAAWGWHGFQDVRLRRAFVAALEERRGVVRTDAAAEGGGIGDLRLSLVSYNIWALPLPLPGMERLRRLPAIPGRLAALDADVILLQEAFDVRVKEFFASYFTDYHRGPELLCREPMWPVGEKDCTGGLATLSRLPVVEERFWVHPTGEAPKLDERNGRKGFLLSRLETSLGPVDLVNIHLYAGRSEEDEDHRLLQLRRLKAVLDSAGSAGRPVILAGDLNVVHPGLSAADPSRAPSRAYRLLVDSLGFVDTHPRAEDGDLSYDAQVNPYAGVWYNRWEGRQVFDYVLVRVPEGMRLRVVERRRVMDVDPLSDHYGVLAVLELAWYREGEPGP
ncbi:MAG: hypothetical protein AMXMBFR53_01200 [Gemmatimonadota bacterium]